MLPAQSLNAAGIEDVWKLKLIPCISPALLKLFVVVYLNITVSHPLGQQLSCILAIAVYMSSITTHAFCTVCARLTGVLFHPPILP